MQQMKAKLPENKFMYLTAWMDKKPVHLLSTFPKLKTSCKRTIVDKNNNYNKQIIEQPSIVQSYNSGMGGTDVFDQRLSYYRPKFKSKKWMSRIFTHFLNASAINAYILYKLATKQHSKYSLLKFLVELIQEMAFQHQF